MAHCGYEPSAVLATMGSLKESLRAVRGFWVIQVSALAPTPGSGDHGLVVIPAAGHRPADRAGPLLWRREPEL